MINDPIISRVNSMLTGRITKEYPFDKAKVMRESDSFSMLFRDDIAFELGTDQGKSLNMTCVTSDRALVEKDAVCVCGPDISGIRETYEKNENNKKNGDPVMKDSFGYARICMVLTEKEEFADTKVHGLLQDMDFVKFHIFPENIMIRTSGQSVREQLRIGKKAVRGGITFEMLGNTYIAHYKKDPRVLAVRVIYVTDPGFDYAMLEKEALLTASVRNSLSMIQKGLPKDCVNCTISDICGEIEGLRELHFNS